VPPASLSHYALFWCEYKDKIIVKFFLGKMRPTLPPFLIKIPDNKRDCLTIHGLSHLLHAKFIQLYAYSLSNFHLSTYTYQLSLLQKFSLWYLCLSHFDQSWHLLLLASLLSAAMCFSRLNCLSRVSDYFWKMKFT